MWNRKPAVAGFEILVLICLFMCATPAIQADDFGQFEPKVAALVTPEKFPDMGAVILLSRRVHTWSFRETEITQSHIFKILTREGMEEYGNYISEDYAEDIFDYHLRIAVTSPEGERRSIDPDRIRKIETGDGRYQHRVAFPGLDLGSIVEIHEKIKTEESLTSGRWDFSAGIPTLRSELIFRVPGGSKIIYSFRPKNNRREPRKEKEDRYDLYTFIREVVPPYRDEPFMSREYVGNPTIYYHLSRVTMAEYLSFYNTDYDDRLIEFMEKEGVPWDLPLGNIDLGSMGKAFQIYFNPKRWSDTEAYEQNRSFLKTLTDKMPPYDSECSEDFLLEVLDIFHRNFQKMDSRFFYRNPEEALRDREGNKFQLAYILKRILAELGIKAVSVVVTGDINSGALNYNSPDPGRMRYPVLIMTHPDGERWIDPFCTECGVNQLPWKIQGTKGLWLKYFGKFSRVVIPVDHPGGNSICRREEVEIDPEGHMSGSSRTIITGQYLLELFQKKDVIRDNLTTENVKRIMAGGLPENSIIKDLQIEKSTGDSLSISCRFLSKNFVKGSGDLLNLDFSGWYDRKVIRTAFKTEKREHDIIFRFPMTRRSHLTLRIPEGYSMAAGPENVTSNSDWFSYFRKVTSGEDRIELERSFLLKIRQLEAADYRKAKIWVDEVLEMENEKFFLRRNR